jgi:hypothetical protein
MYFNVLSQKPTFATYPGAIHPGDDPGSLGYRVVRQAALCLMTMVLTSDICVLKGS